MAETIQLKYFCWLSIELEVGLFIDKHKWINHTKVLTILISQAYLLINHVVEKLTAKLHETRIEILVKIERNDIGHLNIDVNTFMKILQDKDLFQYRAMDMFDISYSMLLSFLGSVISLTVLICQLNDIRQ